MIFITIMYQFNVIIHVKRVCGCVVDFSGYAYLNEEVGFKIPTTRSRNNSVFCGALL